MAETGASTSWYLLVFATMGFFVATYAAIMSHVPRIPEQRGLLAVVLISAIASLASTITLLVTQRQGGSEGLFNLFSIVLLLAIGAALLDIFYFVQARRRRLAGANWSLYVALALIGCGALWLLSQYGAG